MMTRPVGAGDVRLSADHVLCDEKNNEIEMLTTALSRKIWQKMSLVERLMTASCAADVTPEADSELWSGPC